MTFALRLAAVVVLLGSNSGALAAKPPVAPPATPAARPSATATELARLIVPKEAWNQAMEQIATGLQGQMQMHPGKQLDYGKDFPAKVRSEVEAVLPYDELLQLHARRLSATYTEAELGDLLAFHRSPAGKKWLQKQPANYQAVGAESEARIQKAMPELMDKLIKLAKGYGKAPSAAHGAKPGPKPAAK